MMYLASKLQIYAATTILKYVMARKDTQNSLASTVGQQRHKIWHHPSPSSGLNSIPMIQYNRMAFEFITSSRKPNWPMKNLKDRF